MKNTCPKRQSPLNLTSRPLLIVLSGPSGVGKDALLSRMKQSGYPLKYVTTVTTRAKRAKERDNEDYHFVSTGKFKEMRDNKEFLEWANVYENWYGVPKQPVKEALESGQDTIIKVDTQGAATIKKILPEAVFIFLIPPSMEELVARLTERRTELPFDLALRIKTAEEEMKQLPLFDYVIVNKRDEVAPAASNIKAIIAAEKCRLSPRKLTL